MGFTASPHSAQRISNATDPPSKACWKVEELSGLSQQYISDLKRGKRNPSIITTYHLAQAIGVSHVDLVRPDDGDTG